MDAFFGSLKPGSNVDLREADMDQSALNRLFEALSDSQGRIIAGQAQFDDATFRGAISFNNVTFRGDASFGHAKFQGNAGFANTTFEGRAVFVEAEVSAGNDFSAEFRGLADFSNATFNVHATFMNARFVADARFNRIKVTHECQFQSATFECNADFSASQLEGAAVFNNSHFSGEGAIANFAQVRFRGAALFQQTEWKTITLFEAAQFDRDTSFDGATFRQVQFNGSKVLGYFSMAKAVAKGAIVFNAVEFSAITIIGPVGGELIQFDRAIFNTNAALELTAEWITFNSSRFNEGAVIRLGKAQLQVENVVFSRPTTIASANDPLTVCLTGAREIDLDRTSIHNPPQVVTLRGTDVANLTLSGIDLSQCLFATTAHIDQLTLDGTVTFANRPRYGYLEWIRSRRQMIIEEHHWRSHRLERSQWDKSADHPMATVSPVVAQKPEVVAAIYRSLRKSQEDNKNEPGAADFYFGEMEMRRYSRSSSPSERAIIATYWLTSGYGLRAFRATVGLLVMLVVVSLLLQLYGFSQRFHPAYPDSLLYGAQSILDLSLSSGKISFVALTRWGELLRIVLRVFGPIFIALALLSIRNRIKR